MPTTAAELQPPIACSSPAAEPTVDRLMARLRSGFGATARIGSLGLVDQAILSGTSFLTTVLVGRTAGKMELGIYALGFTIALLLSCVQDSLVTSPYTVLGSRLRGDERARFAGSALVQALAISLALVAGLIVAALVCQAGYGPPGLAPVIWVLAATIPLFSLKELGRRFAFADLSIRTVLALDVAVSALQVAGLLWLVNRRMLTAVTAHAVLGSACGAIGVVWLARARKRFTIQAASLRPAAAQNWSFGKWVLVTQVVWTLHAYVSYWLLEMMLDEQATGTYAACMTVVLFSNPFIMGISNVLAPRAAWAVAEGGAREVRRVITKATLLMAGSMSLFCVAVALGGNWLIGILYGDGYSGHGLTISVLGLAVLIGSIGKVSDDGLRAIERPDVNFRAGFCGLCVSMIATLSLLPSLTLLGAALGLLLGNAAAAALKCGAFYRIVDRQIAREVVA